MRALRWAAASLLVLLSAILGLVGVLLCATLLLLPLGIPVLFLARRLFKTAGQLVVPRAVRHPVDEAQRHAAEKAHDVGEKSARALGRRPSTTARLRRKLHLS